MPRRLAASLFVALAGFGLIGLACISIVPFFIFFACFFFFFVAFFGGTRKAATPLLV